MPHQAAGDIGAHPAQTHDTDLHAMTLLAGRTDIPCIGRKKGCCFGALLNRDRRAQAAYCTFTLTWIVAVPVPRAIRPVIVKENESDPRYPSRDRYVTPTPLRETSEPLRGRAA